MKKTTFYILLLSFIFACEDPETTMRITHNERKLIDSLYIKQTKGLREERDSLCEFRTDSLLSIIVDSIISVRKEEEKQLREQYEETMNK